MNYKIGDIVSKKSEKHFGNGYIFLGTTDREDIEAVRVTKEVMGNKVEIGMFVSRPIRTVESTEWGYRIPIIIAYVELFEKKENTI